MGLVGNMDIVDNMMLRNFQTTHLAQQEGRIITKVTVSHTFLHQFNVLTTDFFDLYTTVARSVHMAPLYYPCSPEYVDCQTVLASLTYCMSFSLCQAFSLKFVDLFSAGLRVARN